MMIIGEKAKSIYEKEVGYELEDIMMESGIIKLYYDHLINFVDVENEKIIRQLETQMEHWIKASPPDEHYDIYQSQRYELDRHRKFYPEIHLKSKYITIYSYLEERMRDICRILYSDSDGSIIKHFAIDILNKYYTIIKKFCPTDLSKDLYKEIIKFRNTRNDLVHNNRKVALTKDDVLQVNRTVELFLYDIGRKISVPVNRPIFRAKRKKKIRR